MGLIFNRTKPVQVIMKESFHEQMLKARYDMLISYGVQKDTAREITLQPNPYIVIDAEENLHYKPSLDAEEIVLEKKGLSDFFGGVKRRTSRRRSNVRAKRRPPPSSRRRRTLSSKPGSRNRSRLSRTPHAEFQ